MAYIALVTHGSGLDAADPEQWWQHRQQLRRAFWLKALFRAGPSDLVRLALKVTDTGGKIVELPMAEHDSADNLMSTIWE